MKNQGDAQPGQARVALPWNHTSVIGNSVPRVDAYERVTGTALYTLDMQLPDMLHAAVVRCPFANAIVKRIDHSEVMGMPGVRALLSSSDPEGQLVLPYPWWVPVGPPMHLFETRCRYAGEEVIAVAAETATQAWEAARAIEVEYEELPFLLDHEQALAPNVPRVHDKGNLVRPESVYKRGNVAQGFAAADAVAEETYRTSCLIHTIGGPRFRRRVGRQSGHSMGRKSGSIQRTAILGHRLEPAVECGTSYQPLCGRKFW